MTGGGGRVTGGGGRVTGGGGWVTGVGGRGVVLLSISYRWHVTQG